MFIKGYWLAVVFMPIFPLCFYIVSGERPSYRLHGSLSVIAFVRLYRWRALTYMLTVFVESALLALIFVAAIGAAALLVALFSSAIGS